MPNLATALKDEICRLARKEIKSQVGTTKKAVSQYRHEIAALKRQVQEQEKRIAFLEAQERKRLDEQPSRRPALDKARFSARSVKAQRDRLGLSALDYGRLVGVSAKSIYDWEQGTTRPRSAQRAALSALRGIGKREAMAKLELLENGKRRA
jgi:DNA-binding transcriptional regulator YiaG|tara:strand:- start:632 stop:1087 length:456 start_codon:yes stop_codon:yes gene_type:complete